MKTEGLAAGHKTESEQLLEHYFTVISIASLC